MRVFASITAVLLFMFLLTSTPAFSQENTQDRPQDETSRDKDAKGHQDAKQNDKDRNGNQDENRRDESRPDARQQDNRDRDNANRQQDQTRPEERRNDNAARQNEGRQDQGRREDQVRPENRGDRAQPVPGEQGRGEAHRGQRIPDDRFRASFGREHHFHVDRARIVNQAQPEFFYSGYTFQLAQAWPADWSYDDDCYVDYIDGDYYLYDAYHPGIRILVFVIGD